MPSPAAAVERPRPESRETLPVAETPAIALREREGRLEGRFALTLAAVVNEEEAAAHGAAPFWLPPLREDQGFQFLYAGGRDRLRCELQAYALGDDAAAARAGAINLWDNLALFLHRQRAYHFVPVAVPAFPAALPWTLWLQPLGLELRAGAAAGFLANLGDARPTLRLPSPAAHAIAHLETLAQFLAVAPFELALTLTPVLLSADLQQRINQALAESWSHPLRYPGGGVVRDEALNQAVGGLLERWLQCPAGLRVMCRIAAAVPLPDSLIALLGYEVFGQVVIPQATPPGGCPWDLRAIMPPGVFPALLPHPGSLRQRGLPSLPVSIPPRVAARGITLGAAGLGGQRRTVRFAEDDRARHSYLLGGTGTGKSTLLGQMISQDIRRGAGVCLIDPHGDLYRQVLDAVPRERLHDLALIDACDSERAVGINFLECAGPCARRQQNFVVNEMIRIFDRLYDLRQTGGPMFEQYMRNALLLALDNEVGGATLMDVPWIFEDRGYRRALRRTCRNPYTVAFWRDQAERANGDASLENMAPYITSKLNQFTSNALLRPIIGQARSTVDLAAAMNEGRIVLVNLAKGMLGALDARLLGMLLIGQLFNAALQRAGTSERRPFYLYVDEAQNFTTDTVAELFAEARKFGLYLTLANQNLAQLRAEAIDEAVLGNVGNLFLFRLGAPDAERLAVYTRPEFSAQALQNLPNFHAVARMLVAGEPTRPFVLQAAAPEPCPVLPAAQRLFREAAIARVRARSTRPVAEVEAALLARKQAITHPDPDCEVIDFDDR